MTNRKNPKSEYGISRVDNEKSRTHGWLVTIQRQGVIHRRHFGDGTHGGKRKALIAARAFRDDIMEKFPPYSMATYAQIVKTNNQTGVVGVSRHCTTNTRHLPEHERRWFWVAAWPAKDGRKRVRFSVNKYGEELAFQLALTARKEGIAALSDKYFNPGVRRNKRRAVNAPPSDPSPLKNSAWQIAPTSVESSPGASHGHA